MVSFNGRLSRNLIMEGLFSNDIDIILPDFTDDDSDISSMPATTRRSRMLTPVGQILNPLGLFTALNIPRMYLTPEDERDDLIPIGGLVLDSDLTIRRYLPFVPTLDANGNEIRSNYPSDPIR